MMESIKFNPPLFMNYIVPYGSLDTTYESHGLWNYYLCARSAYETHELHSFKLEGEWEIQPEYRQIFTSIARMYGVLPEAMAKCWDMVDAQCFALELPKLPDEERYRFDRPIIIH